MRNTVPIEIEDRRKVSHRAENCAKRNSSGFRSSWYRLRFTLCPKLLFSSLLRVHLFLFLWPFFPFFDQAKSTSSFCYDRMIDRDNCIDRLEFSRVITTLKVPRVRTLKLVKRLGSMQSFSIDRVSIVVLSKPGKRKGRRKE